MSVPFPHLPCHNSTQAPRLNDAKCLILRAWGDGMGCVVGESMTERNGRQMIENLKRSRPDVVITVTREEDPYGVWDGDEPLPDGHYVCYDHDVTAAVIRDGCLIEGTASMGGSWYDVTDMDEDNQACLREISGYLPQMIDEALDALDAQL